MFVLSRNKGIIGSGTAAIHRKVRNNVTSPEDLAEERSRKFDRISRGKLQNEFPAGQPSAESITENISDCPWRSLGQLL